MPAPVAVVDVARVVGLILVEAVSCCCVRMRASGPGQTVQPLFFFFSFFFFFFFRNGAFRCRGNVNRIVCLLLFVAVVVLV